MRSTEPSLDSVDSPSPESPSHQSRVQDLIPLKNTEEFNGQTEFHLQRLSQTGK